MPKPINFILIFLLILFSHIYLFGDFYSNCRLTKYSSRSPGGTPIRRRRSKGGTALLNDPAALIAEALKRKFAQHRHNNSSDKENSLDLSPFSSPETPKVCCPQTHPMLFVAKCFLNVVHPPIFSAHLTPLFQVPHHARRSQGRLHPLSR